MANWLRALVRDNEGAAFMHRGPNLFRLSSMASLALALGGCSFLLVKPAPSPEEWPNPVVASSSEDKCTASAIPAAADTFMAGTLGTLAYIERNSGLRVV